MAKPQSFKKNDPRINRKGAPIKEWTWSGLLKEVAEEQVKLKDGTTQTKKKLIAQSLYRESLKGNVQATKIMMDRMDGLPMQPTEGKTDVSIKFVEGKKDPDDV